jgi:hypothetical protein
LWFTERSGVPSVESEHDANGVEVPLLAPKLMRW